MAILDILFPSMSLTLSIDQTWFLELIPLNPLIQLADYDNIWCIDFV